MDYMAPLPTTELSVQGLFSGLRVGFLGSKVLCLNRQTDVEASPLLLSCFRVPLTHAGHTILEMQIGDALLLRFLKQIVFKISNMKKRLKHRKKLVSKHFKVCNMNNNFGMPCLETESL